LQDGERTAFDVRVVESQLMVAAYTCQREDDYNTFAQRHEKDLKRAYNEMTSLFHRVHGARAGEVERDRYKTELANVQSLEMAHKGPSACRNMDALVQQALAVRHIDEIARLAAAEDVTTIEYPLAACPLAAAPAAKLDGAKAALRAEMERRAAELGIAPGDLFSTPGQQAPADQGAPARKPRGAKRGFQEQQRQDLRLERRLAAQ